MKQMLEEARLLRERERKTQQPIFFYEVFCRSAADLPVEQFLVLIMSDNDRVKELAAEDLLPWSSFSTTESSNSSHFGHVRGRANVVRALHTTLQDFHLVAPPNTRARAHTHTRLFVADWWLSTGMLSLQLSTAANSFVQLRMSADAVLTDMSNFGKLAVCCNSSNYAVDR